MQSFIKLSPVESLMILSPMGVTGKTLLEYAFLELLYNEVLDTYHEWRLPDTRSPKSRKYTMVCRGKKFHEFRPNNYHLPILEPFMEYDNALQLRNLISIVFKNLKSAYNYKQMLVSEHLKTYGALRNMPFIDHLNVYLLTRKGKEMRKMIKRELGLVKQALQMGTEKGKMKQYIQQLGANWMLLDIEEPEKLRKILQLISRHTIPAFHERVKDEDLVYKGISFNLIQHVKVQFTTFDFTFTGYETNFEPADYKRFRV